MATTTVDLSAGFISKQSGGDVDISAGLKPVAAPDMTENAAGRGVYAMWDDKGQKQPIPYDKVPQAAQLGYKFDTNPNKAGLTPAQQFAKDQAADPNRKGGTSFMASSGMTPEESTARARQIEANMSVPMQAVAGIAKGGATLMRPVSDVLNYAAGVSPEQWDEELAARGGIQKAAKYGTVGATIASAIPAALAAPVATGVSLGAGAVGAGAGQIIGNAAGFSPAGTAVLTDVLGIGAGTAGAEGGQVLAPKIRPAAARFLPALIDGPPESLMTRAVKPGKNNMGWLPDVQKAIPLMKSAEGQLGRPVAGIDDAIEAAGIAKKNIWQQYQARLGPSAQRGATIDGNQIADAMVNSIDKRTALQNPSLVERIKTTADTYRRPMSINDAEDFLQSTNADLNTYYAKNKVSRQVAQNDPETAYRLAEADSLRDALYSKLDDLTGPGSAQLKKAYGALTNVEKELSGRKLVYDRQQPESLSEQLSTVRGVGKIAKGFLTASPGDIIEGTQNIAVARALKERGSSNAMITRAFQAAQPAQPFPMPAAPPRIAGLLPQKSTGPTILPYYPEMSAGERIAALMQMIRQNPQLALPAKASAIPLPSSF